MQPEFWHERWKNNQLGFHQNSVNQWLIRYWPTLLLPIGSTVFVPLCGKSLDMLWLCDKGYQVIGVELSEIAIRDFFVENHSRPVEQTTRYGLPCWESHNLQLYCADFFDLPAEALGKASGFYDRAALIALPPDTRESYLAGLHQLLPTNSKGLLITLDYPQEKTGGPPFSVTDEMVRTLYQPVFQVDTLHTATMECDIPRFRESGVLTLTERMYALTHIGS